MACAEEYFSDDFRDGNCTHNPAWTARKPSNPWKVVEDMGHHSVVASGLMSWDVLTCERFPAPITGGAFELEFKVRFNSAEVHPAGLNQFEVYLTDSAQKNGAGYRFSLAQGSTANSVLRKKTAEGYEIIGYMRTKYTFPTDDYVVITWSRTSDGAMTVCINGNPYLRATDTTYDRFDTLGIGTVLGGKDSPGTPSPFVIFFTDFRIKSLP